MLVEIFIILIIIFLGFNIKFFFEKYINSRDKYILNSLWIYHLIFGVVFWYYIFYGPGGDGVTYYRIANEESFSNILSGFFKAGPGTSGMHMFNSLPASLLSPFGLSMVYCLIGYIGLVCFYVFFIRQIKYNTSLFNYKLFPLVFFLPNLHFWSAGISKDAILFFCIGLFMYGIQQPSKHLFKIAVAMVVSYIIRPHITIFLISSMGMGYVLDGNLKLYQKIFLGGLFLAAFVLLFDNIMAYLKIEDLNTDTIDQFSENRVADLSRAHTGSSVDISSYPYPLKVFTFLYRPLFFDINGVLAIVASFENLLLLVLSWKLFRINPIKIFKAGNYMVKSLFIFLIIGSLSFSLILGNMGIMLRQKNMFIPALLFICLWGLSYSYQQKRAAEKPG